MGDECGYRNLNNSRFTDPKFFCTKKTHQCLKAIIVHNWFILNYCLSQITVLTSADVLDFFQCGTLTEQLLGKLNKMRFLVERSYYGRRYVTVKTVGAICITFQNIVAFKLLLSHGILPAVEDLFFALYKSEEKFVLEICSYLSSSDVNSFYEDGFHSNVGTSATYLMNIFSSPIYWRENPKLKVCLSAMIASKGDFSGFMDNDGKFLSFNGLLRITTEKDFSLLTKVLEKQQIDVNKEDHFGRRSMDFLIDIDRICVERVLLIIRSGFNILQRRNEGKHLKILF